MKRMIFAVLALLMIIVVVPAAAQENDVPLINIPAVVNDSQSITVERYESAGYKINVGLDATFKTWIGREGVQIFFDDLEAVNGVIDLPANNIWLMNGSYVVWICQTQCSGLSNWLGPVEFTVNDSQLSKVANLHTDISTSSNGVSVTLKWDDSDLVSWYMVWAGLSADLQTALGVVKDEWYRGSSICAASTCSVSIPGTYSESTTGAKYMMVYVLGWGGAGYTVNWSSVTVDLSVSACPPGQVYFNGICVAVPGG